MLPLQRSELIEVLWQSIPNHDKAIRTGAKVVKIEETDKNVHVHLADGTVETGSIVVGADGTHSMTRTYIREFAEKSEVSPSSDITEIPTVSQFYSIYAEGPNRHGIKNAIFYETRDTGMGIQLGTNVEMVRLILYKKLPKPLSTRVEYTRREMEEFAESFFDMSGAPGVTIGDIWPDINNDSAHLVNQEEGFAARWHTQRVVLTGDAAVTSSSVNGLGVNCGLHSTALLASEIQKVVSANANPNSASLEQAFARYQCFRAKEIKRIYDFGYMSMRQMTWDSWTAWFIDRFAKRWISSDTLIKQFAHPMLRNGQILSYVPFEDIEAPMKWRWYPNATA